MQRMKDYSDWHKMKFIMSSVSYAAVSPSTLFSHSNAVQRRFCSPLLFLSLFFPFLLYYFLFTYLLLFLIFPSLYSSSPLLFDPPSPSLSNQSVSHSVSQSSCWTHLCTFCWSRDWDPRGVDPTNVPPPRAKCSEVQVVKCGNVKYSTVQYNTLLYSIVQYSIVKYSTVKYSVVKYSSLKCGEVWYSVAWWSAVM